MAARRKQRRALSRQKSELASKLSAIRREIEYARSTFNAVKEPDLVDACVYNLNALMAQYSYYLRCARSIPTSGTRKERKTC